MYNERTQRPELARSGVLRAQRCRGDASPMTARDLPVFDVAEEARPRRRCDGTMPDESGNSTQNGCARGICTGHGLVDRPLAMVYSPCQAWRDAYAPDVALSRGTLFSELDLPFEGANRKRGCIL